MNKYLEAFERLTSRTYKYADKESVYDDLEVLKPLVDKATSKKPHHFVHGTHTRYYCPECSKRLKKLWSVCPICATRVDWNNENDCYKNH